MLTPTSVVSSLSPEATHLYSRQIGTFGFAMMDRLVQLHVLVSGLSGTGAEICKNLALAGPQRLVIHDDEPVTVRDLGSNFFLRESDLGAPRATASLNGLAALNELVTTEVADGPLTRQMVQTFHVVILCNATKAMCGKVDGWAREAATGFVAVNCFGLACSIFVDFGEEFVITDPDSRQPETATIARITRDNPGRVYLNDEKIVTPLRTGDHVTFRGVNGMTELNGSEPRRIQVDEKRSFTVEDTTSYSAYESGGTVIQVKLHKHESYVSYETACDAPVPPRGDALRHADLAKPDRPAQLHFATQALLAYEEMHDSLPPLRDDAAEGECVAADAVMDMNRSMRVKAMCDRVGEETASIFDDPFWESLDFVVNALDNVPSRLYVDGRCTDHGIPFFESGTHGTRASTEVCIPFLTQAYSDTPRRQRESVPFCTLRYFPNVIEHAVEWARDMFQGLFTDGPREAAAFFKDSRRICNEDKAMLDATRLQRILDLIQLKSKADCGFDTLLSHAMDFFECLFYHDIEELIDCYPADCLTSDGGKFWCGSKRFPKSIRFDASNPVHVDFACSMARLSAASLGIRTPPVDEQLLLDQCASRHVQKEFVRKNVTIRVDENSESAHDEGLKENILTNLRAIAPGLVVDVPIESLEFEKDDDSNAHVRFIAAAANVRASNYSIEMVSFHEAKMIAGKIVPAVATTTAATTGLVSVEILKLASGPSRPIEDFKVFYLELATPGFFAYRPTPPAEAADEECDPVLAIPTRARPPGHTSWDRIVLHIGVNPTLGNVIEALENELKPCQVDVLLFSTACIYDRFGADPSALRSPFLEIISASGPKPAAGDSLPIAAACTDPTDRVALNIPRVKLRLSAA
eukprot:Polyplicarium_translucidae@DN3386_c1_g1_i2.p1